MSMLRQLIGQLEELIHLYGSDSPLFHSHPNRWCAFNIDDDDVTDEYRGLMVAARKSFKMSEPFPSPPKKCRKEERSQCKLHTAADSMVVMEEEIWKNFPEDLFEAVIARLPIPAFFRFRSVCRKWNSLLNSESFSQHCYEVPPAHPWFYTVIRANNIISGLMYDPSMKKWHQRSAFSLPSKMIILPVASAGGLLCFLDVGHRNFYICNPLTQSSKELPARSFKVWSRIAVGMTLSFGTTGWGYKVLWVNADGEYEVYDSLKGSWTTPGSMPAHMKLPLSLNFRSQAVSVNSTLYFLCNHPEGIVSYDMATGAWKHFTIPAPVYLSDHTLAEYGGRIMLVGLLTKNAATCVCIWELQKMTFLWKEVDRMPNLWCLEFYGTHVKMTCLGNKGLLMLSLRSKQLNRVVTYNVMTREWLKVPGCLVPCGKKQQWVACGTAFYPCLAAVA